MNKFNEFLLDELENSYFDCLSQQICALCYKTHGEYWKLFLDEKVELDFTNVDSDLSDSIKIEYQYMDAPLKYYGIDFYEVDDIYKFEKGETYLVSINAENYPLCKGLTDIDHYFIIYDFDENNFVIHDEYYKKNCFYLDIKKYSKLFNTIYRVELIGKPIEVKDKLYLKTVLQFRNLMYKLYKKMKEGYTFDMNVDVFYLRLKDIYSLKKRMIIVLNNLVDDKNQSSMMMCNLILGKIINKWRATWYNLFKQYIKRGSVSQENLNLEYIKKLIDMEFNVLNEISSDFKTWNQLSEIFSNLHLNPNLNEKIYDIFNGTNIIYFINEIEDYFNIELDPQCLLSSKTLKEFKNKTYIEILEKSEIEC